MIILTGASGGIGKEILQYLTGIDQVIGTYNRTVPKNQSEDKLFYDKLNLKDLQDIKSFVKRWEDKLSRVTLIHFAASSADALAANYKDSDWDQVMEINLKGNFALTRALLPIMIQERFGRIIHISSVVGIQSRPGTIAYSTSKTGLLGMSRVFAKENARFNITSNVLVLGYFEVGLIETLGDEVKKGILNQIPSKSFGKVSNIANAIKFLIESPYVNGAAINIDGAI
ncbi:hypothetical protein A2276_06065 [candidate division WOR-1 bacterium RIFOXYA12_FULL_43_27]|uniref:3-oxoacyl-ACP reductase n=1 Tax=candidate division WOR-1 bacterium RIFOXYC2_FULL_46_14 TaxID=1802587 RepID=A0A1F4U3M5_UNCSA|nr:MAG: hypothetical protein A2276_06065 [candidate division WOR-1 bacterium RIFOXYA12_FULL_43_27]OGC20223.1 MAG: hypothetical protein A2292_04065 [candidate division WOR-1 bacterium RIFOXYB2_FULL_46_45]OGC32038.1 MAG: hypothetical protein A2232_07380 [candidate division WOR-1 bacterium RIFOXYA2_FULL_46_56]OGC39440.1 MAG: hypothetical protein A2438_07745 [candidate division WOR-1 bacterium RIFOXYC2_FULL_46_14]